MKKLYSSLVGACALLGVSVSGAQESVSAEPFAQGVAPEEPELGEPALETGSESPGNEEQTPLSSEKWAEQPQGPPEGAMLSSRDLVRGESYGDPAQGRSRSGSGRTEWWNETGLGRIALSVENLFGLYTNAVGSGGSYQSELHFSFSGGGSRNPMNIPRLGVDVFIGDHFSLGMSGVGYTGPGQGGWLVNPRAGFYWGIKRFGLWPKFGFSFFESGTKVDSEWLVQNGANLSVELPLVVRILPAVSITLGPAFHIPLSGKVRYTGTFTQSKLRSFGGYVGVVVSF